MTDEELNQIRQLILTDPHGEGFKAMLQLTTQERTRMVELAKAESKLKVQEVIAKAETDGTMDQIRELYAQDLAKKKARKKR